MNEAKDQREPTSIEAWSHALINTMKASLIIKANSNVTVLPTKTVTSRSVDGLRIAVNALNMYHKSVKDLIDKVRADLAKDKREVETDLKRLSFFRFVRRKALRAKIEEYNLMIFTIGKAVSAMESSRPPLIPDAKNNGHHG